MSDSSDLSNNAIADSSFVMPASFAQRRLWFLDQLEPGSTAYNIPVALELKGELNSAALEASLDELIRRHEILRTTLAGQDGEPVQVIAPFRPRPLSILDVSTEPEERRVAVARRRVEEDATCPFDLEVGPLFRYQLLRLNAQHHIFIFTAHHIIFDGWSLNILCRELSILYRACVERPDVLRAQVLPEPEIQYADYAIWQRDFLQGENLVRQLDYWKGQLAGELPVLDLPTDRPLPAVQTFRGGEATDDLPAELAVSLVALARSEKATLFMVLLAAYAVLLSRYTGQEDLVIGSPIAGRNRRETEELIGFFVNTLALRLDLSGVPTFRELLRRVRGVCLGAYALQDLPFEKLVEELAPQRDLARSPLFQTMFALQNMSRPRLDMPGLDVHYLPVEQASTKFDLSLTLAERQEGLSVWLSYNTDLFEPDTAQCLLRHYRTLLQGIVARPDDSIHALPMLTPDERRQMLVDWNRTAATYPDTSLVELFAEQVRRTPEATAVIHEHRAWSYAELEARSNRLAEELVAAGIDRGSVVALLIERSPELHVGLLAVLKVGGVVLLLDPALPTARLGFILADSQARVLVKKHTSPALAFAEPALELDGEGAIQPPPPHGPRGSRGLTRELRGVTWQRPYRFPSRISTIPLTSFTRPDRRAGRRE